MPDKGKRQRVYISLTEAELSQLERQVGGPFGSSKSEAARNLIRPLLFGSGGADDPSDGQGPPDDDPPRKGPGRTESSDYDEQGRSVFISHAREDDGFTKQLYFDLCSSNVNPWCAAVNLTGGQRFRQLNKRVRSSDRVVVVISEQSLRSEWVADEVETALEEEETRRQLYLIPMRIDSAIDGTTVEWARKLAKERLILDFAFSPGSKEYYQVLVKLVSGLFLTEKLA